MAHRYCQSSASADHDQLPRLAVIVLELSNNIKQYYTLALAWSGNISAQPNPASA